MSKTVFSIEEKKQISEAVASLEKESSGELVLYYAKSSDSYPEAAWKLTSIIGILFLSLTIFLSYNWLLPPYYTPLIVSLTVLLSMVITYFISLFIPIIRTAITNTSVIEHRVLTKARDMFLQEQVFNTVERTGILIYISALERKVVVLGDSGINQKINQSDWEQVVKHVIDGIKSKQMTKGIIEAVEICKMLLLDNGFTIKTGDTNELHNSIRVEE